MKRWLIASSLTLGLCDLLPSCLDIFIGRQSWDLPSQHFECHFHHRQMRGPSAITSSLCHLVKVLAWPTEETITKRGHFPTGKRNKTLGQTLLVLCVRKNRAYPAWALTCLTHLWVGQPLRWRIQCGGRGTSYWIRCIKGQIHLPKWETSHMVSNSLWFTIFQPN